MPENNVQKPSLFSPGVYLKPFVSGLPSWDYVFLTASNEAQAAAYRMQINRRKTDGELRCAREFIVLPDPGGLRVGSGGATLNAIRCLYEREGGFDHVRALIIHSGGDSKRIPQYSALGKLFSPVPKMLGSGRRSSLFDELMATLETVPQRMAKSGVMVCSGDVLLSFDPLQIEGFTQNAAALSMKKAVQTGSNHGVFLKDEMGNVSRFLHKQTVAGLESAGAVDAQGQVDIDTGAVILDQNIVSSLYQLVNTEEKFAAFVNQRVRLSFYADFLYPLASESTLEQFYRETPEGSFTPELEACRKQLWNTLHKYSLKLLRLSQARFIHFGTTSELLALMTSELMHYRSLGWGSQTLTNSEKQGFTANCVYIAPDVQVGVGSYIEDSVLLHGSEVGKGCIVSGVTLAGHKVPSGTVVHGLKLQDGRFVVRMYAVEDNPKKSSLFGMALQEPLWTASLYPVRNTIGEALDETLKRYKTGFPPAETESDIISLKDSFNLADQQALLDWQDEVSERIKLDRLLQAIEQHLPLYERIQSLRHITPRGVKRLLSEAENSKDDLEGLGRRIRIQYAFAFLEGKANATEHYLGIYEDIRDTMHRHSVEINSLPKEPIIHKEEVTVRLPLRVNFGGGWSDTPPYCLENGGIVLNAAIMLAGEAPAEAVVRKLEKHVVVLASKDSDNYEEFSDISPLRSCSDPLDPFALHKAALITCGLIPGKSEETLEQVLKRLGGGIYLSTQVKNVPRGSGFGTSSILSGACAKALGEFTGCLMDEKELFNQVLCIEQLMSTGGGWQDQAGGLIPGIKLLSTTPGLVQSIHCEKVRMLPLAMLELSKRFCLIYTGQRRLARKLLRDVVVRYVSGDQGFADALYDIQRLAVLMRFELEKGNITNFAKLLTEHWALSKRIDSDSTNETIEAIFSAVDDLVDGKMICGAGGGGFLQVIMKPGVSKNDIRKRLRESQMDSAIDVWDSEFVIPRT